MGPSELQILTAGYSMHQKPVHIINANGLGHYLIRLQSLGKCRSKLNNELELLEPGDLLLFAPNDPYELKIAAEQQTRENHSVYSADYHIFVQGTWVQEWWNERNRPNKIKVPLSEGIIGSFRQIMTELRRIPNNTPQIMEYYFKSYVWTLIGIILNTRFQRTNRILQVELKTISRKMHLIHLN